MIFLLYTGTSALIISNIQRNIVQLCITPWWEDGYLWPTTAKIVIGDAAYDDYCDDYSGHLDDGVKLRTISDALQVACAVSTQTLVPDERLATTRRFF